MTTVNKRAGRAQAVTINGIAAGGLVTANILAGYDEILQSPADGLDIPVIDRLTEFVRGSLLTQDWIEMVNLLTGAVGTYVFYERKSGVAAATGYVKHTLTNPVIHQCAISLMHRGYGNAMANFECKAADETKGISDMWALTDSQAAPSYVPAARGLEITTCVHGSQDIYHVTGLDFTIAMLLSKASHDGDVGYTAVDAELAGISPTGTLRCQDAEIDGVSNKLKCQELIAAAAADLVLTIKQSQGVAAKTVTIANVVFDSINAGPAANTPYTEYSMPFRVANDASTPLTLAGDNKIITIA